MATKDKPKRKPKATKSEQKSKVEPEQARAKTDAAPDNMQEALSTTQAEVEEERQARVEAERALAETRRALDATRIEVEQEREARKKAEQAKAEVELALTEARNIANSETATTEQFVSMSGEDNGEQRVSFVIGVTVDERGQPLRTEIKHAQSGKRKSIMALDTKELSAFIMAHLSPVIPEPVTPVAPSPAIGEAPPPKPSKPAAKLTITSLELRRIGFLTGMAFIFNPNEPFVVQADFKLEGEEALTLTGQEAGYEVQIQAYEVTSGTTTEVTTHQDKLVKDILDYHAYVQAPALPSGLYRLKTLITLQEPTKLAGRYEGPIFEISGAQPSVVPAGHQGLAQPQ